MNFSRISHLILSVIFGTLLVFSLLLILQGKPQTAYASPTNLFATPNGAGSCKQTSPCTIQDAVAAASDGDTLYLSKGTYTGAGDAVITVTKSITIFGGWDGSSDVPIIRDPTVYTSTLDGQYARRVIYIKGHTTPITTTIDGVEIIHGDASSTTAYPRNGGGIYGRNTTPHLSNNIIRFNRAASSSDGYGGGIYLTDIANKAVITANLIYSNVASLSGYGYGGGIIMGNGTDSEIVNNFILTNTASITNGQGFGGGIRIIVSDNAIIQGNEIKGNIAQAGTSEFYGSHGGGISCRNSDNVIISDNLLQNNIASLLSSGGGGALSIWDSDDVLIFENIASYNIASAVEGIGGYGGAIYIQDSLNSMINANQIMSNTAAVNGGSGGGVYFSQNTSFNMGNNILADNNEGGGISLTANPSKPMTGTLANNTFVRNISGGVTGAGAIDIHSSSVLITITNNIIYSHTNGVYVHTGSTATLSNNLYYQNTTNISGVGTYTETNPITGQDPLLNNTFHLLVGSPAIDAGTPVSWVFRDFDSDLRPQGPAYDIGADEFQYQNVFLPFVVRSNP